MMSTKTVLIVSEHSSKTRWWQADRRQRIHQQHFVDVLVSEKHAWVPCEIEAKASGQLNSTAHLISEDFQTYVSSSGVKGQDCFSYCAFVQKASHLGGE